MDKWFEKYNIAKDYYLEYGNLLVPDKFMYKNINLGNWIYLQRKSYKDKNLLEEKQRLLNEIGMVWNPIEDTWNYYYDVACKFKNEFNTLVIPVSFVYLDCNIGKWISHQRQRYKKKIISYEQIKKLESIGMVWDASNNNISTSFPEQAIFFYIKKIFNDAINRYNDLGFELDIYIPSLNTAIEYDGFVWHLDNNNDIKKNKKCLKHNINLIRIREDGLEELYDENIKILKINRGYSNLEKIINDLFKMLNVNNIPKIDLLKDRNIIIQNYINVYNNQWNNMFLIAKKYHEENGNLINIHDSKVDKWIKHQRQRYNGTRNPLNKEQIEKLESIGMIWDVYKTQWEDYYKIVKDFYLENGNLDIKNSLNYKQQNIGGWISSQRNLYKNNKLSKERIFKLNEIGMIWDASIDVDEIWNNHFELAKKYYEEHGNLDIPIRKKYQDIRLGAWINKMRNEKNKLSTEQVLRLESIGMIWNVHKNKWFKNYDMLLNYYNKNGNIMIPFDYIIDGVRLGEWLKRQMGNRQKLNSEQIKLLENLNVVWERNSNKWDYMFEIAKKYYEEYGNLLVNTHSIYMDENLGYWINHQRDDFQKKDSHQANVNFTNERIEKLESIGMIWDVSSYLWEKNYNILKKYYEKYGNIDMASSTEFENIKIGKWLQNQKSSFRGYKGRKQLTKEQIDKLNNMNIKW